MCSVKVDRLELGHLVLVTNALGEIVIQEIEELEDRVLEEEVLEHHLIVHIDFMHVFICLIESDKPLDILLLVIITIGSPHCGPPVVTLLLSLSFLHHRYSSSPLL
jgi:hypothetical protein